MIKSTTTLLDYNRRGLPVGSPLQQNSCSEILTEVELEYLFLIPCSTAKSRR